MVSKCFKISSVYTQFFHHTVLYVSSDDLKPASRISHWRSPPWGRILKYRMPWSQKMNKHLVELQTLHFWSMAYSMVIPKYPCFVTRRTGHPQHDDKVLGRFRCDVPPASESAAWGRTRRQHSAHSNNVKITRIDGNVVDFSQKITPPSCWMVLTFLGVEFVEGLPHLSSSSSDEAHVPLKIPQMILNTALQHRH